jgi:hypothetical protein
MFPMSSMHGGFIFCNQGHLSPVESLSQSLFNFYFFKGKKPSFTQYPSAGHTEGTGIGGPEPLYWLQNPLSPSTPTNQARQTLISRARYSSQQLSPPGSWPPFPPPCSLRPRGVTVTVTVTGYLFWQHLLKEKRLAGVVVDCSVEIGLICSAIRKRNLTFCHEAASRCCMWLREAIHQCHAWSCLQDVGRDVPSVRAPDCGGK